MNGSRQVLVDNGVVRIAQQLRIDATRIGTDVAGPALIYATVEVKRGRLVYLRDDAEVAAPRSFSLILPPFSVVQARLERCEVSVHAVAVRFAAGATNGMVPSLFMNQRRIEIGRASNPHPAAVAAKRILDSEYATGRALIGVLAKRLAISGAALTRVFAKSFGIPPVRYRQYLRVMDALLRFAAGSSPIDVCHDVGFEDLSRFYDAFRRIACSPPASYRPLGQKTPRHDR